MEYTITNVQTRDEWNFNGNQMVDYAIALQGETGWIKLTQKVGTPPPRQGDTIQGVIENKQTSNGTPYKKFKKVNPAFSQGGGQSNQGRSEQLQGITSQQAEYIIQMLEELTMRRATPEVSSEGRPPTNVMEEDPFAGLGI